MSTKVSERDRATAEAHFVEAVYDAKRLTRRRLLGLEPIPPATARAWSLRLRAQRLIAEAHN